ncbi:MAG: diaminopimelate epimerase [Desulfobacteraceae bacterium]|nr:diaminopimelate epimerase [Desulfobacteraceae bacterium]
MTDIPFYKMSGSGNDFIIIDNRAQSIQIEDLPHWVAKVCRRGMSVGADGVILVEPSAQADFRWRFFNSDGSVAEMCGNGARCVARFAVLNGIATAQLAFETLAGVISAQVRDDQVRIKMTDPTELVMDDTVQLAGYLLPISRVNTGVPHVVMEVKDLPGTNVKAVGHTIRYHQQFAPAGTNVNFIAPVEKDLWAIRTYERGVENETLACGTGNVAAALVLATRYQMQSPISLRTLSGSLLRIFFRKQGEQFDHVHLEGDARVIYKGAMGSEAWKY